MTLKKPQRARAPYMLLISMLMVMAALALFIVELLAFTQREDSLPAGITIAGIPVGNLSDIEASLVIEEAFSSAITLYYLDSPINLNPTSVGFEPNTQVMIAEARASSEIEGGFWVRFINYLLGRENITASNIDLVYNYQRSALRIQLDEIARVFDRPVGSAEYDLQTLTVGAGETGYSMNVENAVGLVESALLSANNRAVELPIEGGESTEVSLGGLEQVIIDYLDAQGFIYDGQASTASVFILDLTTGEEINILSDVAYSAASTNKVGILIDMYRSLDREPNQDEAFLMANSLLCSNNSSSNQLMELFLGSGRLESGLASVTNTMQFVGANNSYLIAPFVEGVSTQRLFAIPGPETTPNTNYDTFADSFNQTTAEDMGTLFSLIYDCANYGSGLMAVYPEGEITQNECRQMVELMSALDLNRLLEAGVPEGTRISHKNGWLPGRLAGARGATTGDAGIVFSPNGRHYVIAVYLWEDSDTTGFERWPIVEEISRAAWNHFNPENPLTARREDLPPTAQECFTLDANGNIGSYNYLPPYGAVDLDNINGWRDGTATTPQPLPGETG